MEFIEFFIVFGAISSSFIGVCIIIFLIADFVTRDKDKVLKGLIEDKEKLELNKCTVTNYIKLAKYFNDFIKGSKKGVRKNKKLKKTK